MPKVLKIDVPKCYCPHCGAEVGPATGIHWNERAPKGQVPRNIEQCEQLMKKTSEDSGT